MVPINRLKHSRTEAVQHASFAVPLVPQAVVPLAKIDTGNVSENGIKSWTEVSVVSTCKQIAIRMCERTIVGRPCERGAVGELRLAGCGLSDSVPVVRCKQARVNRSNPVVIGTKQEPGGGCSQV